MISEGVRPGKSSVWAELAADIPSSDIQWRIDGKPTARDGKYFARYVAYVDAQFVRARLDSVVPGEWDLTMELLPQSAIAGGEEDPLVSFKARLQILGVIREDIGMGRDYKAAATDAFKRAAVRFGIGHELYDFDMNWVQLDSDSKYAKPVEDPQKAYERRHSGAEKGGASSEYKAPQGDGASAAPSQQKSATKNPADKVMPFGKTKGKKLGDLSDTELEKTLDWCRTTDAKKFADLITSLETVLDSRGRQATEPADVDPDSYPQALVAVDDDLPF